MIKNLHKLYNMNSGRNYVTTSWLKDNFTSFEPPTFDERHKTVSFVETVINKQGDPVGNQTTFVVQKGKQPLYPNIVGCRNPDTLADMMEEWKSKINEHYEIDRSRDMHAGLWPADMTHWEHCTEDCFSKYCQKQNI